MSNLLLQNSLENRWFAQKPYSACKELKYSDPIAPTAACANI
jgi:hypothetical protein